MRTFFLALVPGALVLGICWVFCQIGWKNLVFLLKTVGEMIRAFHAIPAVTRAVWICGSARFQVGSPEYNLIREVVSQLVATGYRVVNITNGGGPGAMGASSEGAHVAGGKAYAFALKLEKEEAPNPWAFKRFIHRWFFARKVMMLRNCEAVIFFRGGFGSLDELFEILCMIQTGKAKKGRRFPVYLVDREYWEGLADWLNDQLLTGHCIDATDLSLFSIVGVNSAELEAMIEDLVAHLTAGYLPTPEEAAAARKAREHQWTSIQPYCEHVDNLRVQRDLRRERRRLFDARSSANGHKEPAARQ